MTLAVLRFSILVLASAPLIYYMLVLYSSWQFFREPQRSRRRVGTRGESGPSHDRNQTPPVSNLKPVHRLDPEAYENFASFCVQDYPQYEIIFCVSDASDPALPTLQKLIRDFPECDIRVLIGSGRLAVNDKVAKLARMCAEAKYETVVISDSDVRVEPDYLRTVVAELSNPGVGATTCLYVPTENEEETFAERLHSIGMISEFYAGILVARSLDGVKFALGPTIATTKSCLAAFGGYPAIENRPADDLLVGRLIADQGYEVRLLKYWIRTVPDFQTLRDLFLKRLRWTVVMRNLRPWGHAGMIFTFGLPWTLAAIWAASTWSLAMGYLGAYLACRAAITIVIGKWGLKQTQVIKELWLVPVWDVVAVVLWATSFTRNTIRWRNGYYAIRQGRLVSLGTDPETENLPGRI